MSKNREQIFDDITNMLSNRSDDYLFGYLDALLPLRDESKTLATIVDVVMSILSDRGSI